MLMQGIRSGLFQQRKEDLFDELANAFVLLENESLWPTLCVSTACDYMKRLLSQTFHNSVDEHHVCTTIAGLIGRYSFRHSCCFKGVGLAVFETILISKPYEPHAKRTLKKQEQLLQSAQSPNDALLAHYDSVVLRILLSGFSKSSFPHPHKQLTGLLPNSRKLMTTVYDGQIVTERFRGRLQELHTGSTFSTPLLRLEIDDLRLQSIIYEGVECRFSEGSGANANTHSRTAYTEKLSALTAGNNQLKAQVNGKTSKSKKKASHPHKDGKHLSECSTYSTMVLSRTMRTKSINGKKYVLVIVDDYTDLVMDGYRTLMEAARTMLIFAKAPLFLWAEAVATACYTLNRSLVHTLHGKTYYELLKGKKPNLQYFRVFGSLCYPTNDYDDVVQNSNLLHLQSRTHAVLHSKDPEPPSVPPIKKQVDDLFQWFDDDEVVPIPPVVPITTGYCSMLAPGTREGQMVHLLQQLSQKRSYSYCKPLASYKFLLPDTSERISHKTKDSKNQSKRDKKRIGMGKVCGEGTSSMERERNWKYENEKRKDMEGPFFSKDIKAGFALDLPHTTSTLCFCSSKEAQAAKKTSAINRLIVSLEAILSLTEMHRICYKADSFVNLKGTMHMGLCWSSKAGNVPASHTEAEYLAPIRMCAPFPLDG
ncbi:integrase, catalytic region, zinc finger, CCHC-type containing protein [Tanacetum coccineum]